MGIDQMMQKKRISGSFWIAFKWGVKLGMFNTAIYGKNTVFL